MKAPPLRFLGVVVGGWVCARAAVLAPDWFTETLEASELPRQRPDAAPAPSTLAAAAAPALHPFQVKGEAISQARSQSPKGRPTALALDFTSGQVALAPAPPLSEAGRDPEPLPAADIPMSAPASIPAVLESGPSRLSVSGWAIVRQGSEPQLASGGLLGGSQAGARLTYRMTGSLALSARLSSPLRGDGAEGALGVEWQPSRSIPIKLLAERRQAIGDGGRSAFALVAHGGVSDVKVAGPVVADAYVQAGVVGLRDRDGFVDGAVKLSLPVTDNVSVGAGAWGAAQPNVERLDVGPHVTVSLPGGPARLRLSAEWRVRVAGDAEPGSGPALTLATDF